MNRKTILGFAVGVVVTALLFVAVPNTIVQVATGTTQDTTAVAKLSLHQKDRDLFFLVELGNGDKFLFDIGSGSHERIAAMKIPYDFLDKVFIGHLHVDHYGDLPTFWLGGTVMNRLVPLRIWGPSGSKPEYGGKRISIRRCKCCYL